MAAVKEVESTSASQVASLESLDLPDILSAIGSIASIFGLSIQTVEVFRSRYPDNKVAQHMGVFLVLSDLTESWKELHREYHTLLPDIRSVAAVITVHEGRNEHIRPIQDLRSKDVAACFTSGNLSTAIYDFESRTEHILSRLRRVGEPGDATAQIEALDSAFAKPVGLVRSASVRAINIHVEFCKFLEGLRGIDTNRWNATNTKYVSRHHLLIRNRFQEIILEADRAIIAMLDLNRIIADEVKRSEKI